MIIRIFWKTGAGKVKCLSLWVLGLFLGIHCCQAQALVKAQAETLEGNPGIAVSIQEEKIAGGEMYSFGLHNTTGADQKLRQISVSLQPDKKIPDGIPYMIGADEMQDPDGQMAQLLTGVPAENDYSNMYVMVRWTPKDYLLVGMISWRVFLCKVSLQNGSVQVRGDGDHKLLASHQQIPFEKIVVLKDSSWQDLLERYARVLVKENRVSSPRHILWKGWSTWDYYAQKFSSADVEANTGALREMQAHPNIIQIDGGWWKQRGDYLDGGVRDNLDGGIKGVVERIHQAGYKAGLHFDGFRASEGAKIVKMHPEYFIHKQDGSLMELGRDAITKDPLVFWDYSQPGATDYIRKVMENARQNWKIDYFKIDFMQQGLYKGVSHLPVTNVERFRMGIEAMKKGMGPKVYFLACSSNFGTMVGLAEGMRMGGDIHPDYFHVRSRVKHTSGNFYLQNQVFNADPDYLVVRGSGETDEKEAKKPTLTYDQAAMWSLYVSIYGNARFNSDNLTLLGSQKKDLIRNCFDLPYFTKTIPLDIWDHYKTETDAPSFFLAKAEDGTIGIGLFNWSEGDQTFTIGGFAEGAQLKEFNGQLTAAVREGKLSLPLQGTHAVLMRYEGKESFETLRHKLWLATKNR